MAHTHHHESADDHAHRNPEVSEVPLDSANQSLADALRSSFGILKGIMLVIVVLYLLSNVKCIQQHQQALVLHFGRLDSRTYDAGMVRAWPYPIDEILLLPAWQSNEVKIDSHTITRRANEIGKGLAFLASSRAVHRGLDPMHDGALMTADRGLVHIGWTVTYKIDAVEKYVANIRMSRIPGEEIDAAAELIRSLVETAGIHVAAEMTAEETIRTRQSDVRAEMKRRLNERLASLDSGIIVTLIEMYENEAPLQIHRIFDQTLAAAQAKDMMIRNAQKEATKRLNDAAGSTYHELLRLLDDLDPLAADDPGRAELEARIDRLLEDRVEGWAGGMIRSAGAFFAEQVGRIKSDKELYDTLIPEFERNPALLVGRLWEQTRRKIFASDGVLKIFVPFALRETRIRVPTDPEQEKMMEKARLREKEFDPTKMTPEVFHPVGVFKG